MNPLASQSVKLTPSHTSKKLKAGILYFPGTNCERDLILALEAKYGISCDLLWHTESFTVEHDLYFLPGGFSYGDYLRSGALAARSVSLKSLHEAARKGRLITGICNGFQILTESGLLPGALIRNDSLKHICKWVELQPSGRWSEFIKTSLHLPVSHSEGNFIAPPEVLKELLDNNQIILRYRTPINGSLEKIAGISSENGKVIGLMPHPERAIHETRDNVYSKNHYGKYFFDALLNLL